MHYWRFSFIFHLSAPIPTPAQDAKEPVENSSLPALCIYSPRGSGTLLEFGCLGSTWERYHVADVLHTGHEEDKALEAEAETTVGAASILAGVEIPPHILHRDVATVDFADEFVIVLLAHATADNLANLREEHVGTLHGAVVVINLHIEGLDILGIVGHDDGLLEVLLDEEALVLAGEVHTPAYGELKLVTVGYSLFEYLDTLGVRQKFSQNTFPQPCTVCKVG